MAVNQQGHAASCQVVHRDVHHRRFGQLVADEGCGVEGVRVVLVQAEGIRLLGFRWRNRYRAVIAVGEQQAFGIANNKIQSAVKIQVSKCRRCRSTDIDALKGNYVSSYLDFEKGKVVGRSDFHLSDGLGKNFIGMFFKKELETDFSPYLPGENLISVQALALDLKGIDEFLSTRPQAQGYVDFLLRESGMDRPTLLKTFGGDLMLATYFDDEEDFNLLFATGIRDEEEARNILRKGVESNMLRLEEDGSYRVAGFGVPGAFSITRGGADYGRIWLRDGMLFFSNHAGLYEKLKDGKLPTSERAPETHLKNLKNHAFAMNMGFDSFQRIFEESLELDLGSLHFSAADSKLDFLLQLKRQNTNSLKLLFAEINEAYLREKEKAPMM